jgi:hypothetical protein
LGCRRRAAATAAARGKNRNNQGDEERHSGSALLKDARKSHKVFLSQN